MILTKVTLKDYGVYKGKNEFDLTCTEDRPIVLIGGTNGAGKTTLFESIMLCLYGMSIMDKKTTRKLYEKFLAKKIHRYMGGSAVADFASVIVQFKFFHDGRETEYLVDRTWRNDDGKIIEQLALKKRNSDQDNFENLDTVEAAHWQSFIEDLIPKGIVRLFFFDGEKIVRIAKEGSEDITIRDSFKSLLGLDLVEQLHSDLHVNLMRNLTGGTKTLQQDYEKCLSQKEENLGNVEQLQTRLAQKQTEMDRMRTDIDAAEARISKIGGGFADRREETKTRLAQKTLTQDNIQKRIQEMCMGVLPFSMIPGQMKELEANIRRDEQIQRDMVRSEILSSKSRQINSELQRDSFWEGLGVKGPETGKIRAAILSLLDSGEKPKGGKEMFGLSSSAAARMANIMQEAAALPETLKKDAQKFVEVGEEITNIQKLMASAPNDDEIGPLISELGQMHSRAGELQAEMDHIEREISSGMSLQKHIDVNLRNIVSQIYKDEKSHLKVDLTQKVQTVLEEFAKTLKAKKISLLEQYMLDSLNILMHKKDFAKKVEINPETFEVVLFRDGGDPFPKDLLSEGEKQMFATAILWALAKTSGRPLPFMIDTPLARLDEGHRLNLVEEFFPLASHQVVIFSTDKEIEREHLEKLRPFMSKAYAMEYVSESGCSKANTGYFWNERGEKIVAVR